MWLICQSHGNINLQNPSRLEAHPLASHLVQVSVVKRFMHPPPIAEEAMEKKDPPSPMDQPEESFFRQPIQESLALRLRHIPWKPRSRMKTMLEKEVHSFKQPHTMNSLTRIRQESTYFCLIHIFGTNIFVNINLRLNSSPWRPIVSAACFAAVGNRNLIRPLVWDNRWAARIKRYIC